MGCSSGDSECDDDETPPHSVTLSDFAVLETEVTVSQYEIVTGDNPSYDRGASDGLNAPVEGVDWYGAKEFCDAVDGRLCTEAEWEYAARGGTTTKYYCGDDESCLYQIAWYGSGSGGKKQEVGGKNPNEFGLYDMLGNVDEWVNDWYHDDYYSDSPQNDPGGPVTSDNKVRRGGGFDLGTLRVSYRGVLNPSGSGPVLGFRCCKSPDE
jgi:formylglycine-generating enzyme required for sulfatase activity